MCILVNALKRQDPRLTLEVRVGLALAEVGPSITLASLTEVFAFSIGALAPTPACKEFSLFAGKLNFSFLSNHIDMRATLTKGRDHEIVRPLKDIRRPYHAKLKFNCEIFLMQLLQCYWIIFYK